MSILKTLNVAVYRGAANDTNLYFRVFETVLAVCEPDFVLAKRSETPEFVERILKRRGKIAPYAILAIPLHEIIA